MTGCGPGAGRVRRPARRGGGRLGPGRVGANEPAAAALSALSALVFLGRRWQPLAASVTAFAALTLSVAVMPRSTTAQFFGTLATFAIVGAINREREAVVAWFAGAGMLAYAAWVDPFGGGAGDFALSLAFGTTMWGAGLLVARRSRSAAAAELRAQLAERDRAEQARRAVEEERAHIARELHDIVSHGLSVVVLQTLAARAELADGGDPGNVDRHLDAVETTAREALGEMRRCSGSCTAPTSPNPTAPHPGTRSLPQLVDRAAAAGLRPSRSTSRRRRPPRRPGAVGLPGRPGGADERGQARARGAPCGRRPGRRRGGGGHRGQRRRQRRRDRAGGRRPGTRSACASAPSSTAAPCDAGPTTDGGFLVTATFPLDTPPDAVPQR